MNASRTTLFLLFPFCFCLFFNCRNDSFDNSHQPGVAPNARVVIQLDIPALSDKDALLDSALRVARHRLEGEWFYSNLVVEPDRGQLIADLIRPAKSKKAPSRADLLKVAAMLAREGRLAFYNTYRLADTEVNQPFQDMISKEQGLANLLTVSMISSYAAPVAFAAPNKISAADSILSERLRGYAFPPGLGTAWSDKPDDNSGKPMYSLFFLKGEPVLTGSAVESVEASPSHNPREAEISVTLKPEFVGMWEEMTRLAADNGNREIAILLDGRVLSAPRVMNAISSGKMQIAGGFSVPEALDMVRAIRSGSLPCPARVASVRKPDK